MKKVIISAMALMPLLASAEVSLPEIIGDNMVLQQKSDSKLWGWSNPNKEITLTTSWNPTEVVKVKSDKSGRWEAFVKTPSATFDAQTISIKGDGSDITISNVAIGEVWFCSGQSNMEMPLRGFWCQPVEGAAQAIAYSGKYPGIRVATVPKRASYTPQDKVEGKWKVSSPENAGEFSAVAYFFARSLSDIMNVPVGIIACAYGGSKVEGWQPKEQLDKYPEWNVEKEKADSTINEWERINVMYNAMLHPLIGYTVKGFLWNQGESNVGMHQTYAAHLADMVQLWREQWGQGNLPFYSVEIPGWNYQDPEGSSAALLREAQHKAMQLIPNAGIVCTSDLVYPYELEDIHASQKQKLGERLAFMAANKTYGIYAIPATYPTYNHMERDGKKVILHFDNADSGLTPNDVLEGFEVAGADRVFHPANATEDWNNRTIIVESDSVDDIVAVRYNFKNFAVGKVFDMMGMPLIPFRTDNWDK
jgi:sialate O-acetylesterase